MNANQRECCLNMACVLLMASSLAAAEDTVWLTPPDGFGPPRPIQGEIIEFTGEAITIQLASGQQLSYETSRVVRFETERTPEQREAERLRDAGDLSAALEQYQAALRADSRRWMRRRLLAEVISLQAATGRVDLAGRGFLTLVADDPLTVDYFRIPLCWWPTEPSRTLELQAAEWLKSKDETARLLGASWLLTTRMRPDAKAALTQLERSLDQRIGRLAQAQLWRTEIATAEQAEKWRAELASFPPALRGGPDYVLGQAFSRIGQYELAALHLLRSPLAQPQQRTLAARGLVEAATALERAERYRDAARLYREALDKYSEEAGGDIEARLERLRAKLREQE